MAGWTPLFAKITTSSIWDEPDHVRLAWITMLAHTEKNGICPMTEGGLAALGRLSREKAADALKVLSEPDKRSLGSEHEGRRIERVDGGWYVLNWEKYRAQARASSKRESDTIARAKYRQKAEANGEPYDAEPADDTDQNVSWSGRAMP